MNELRRIKPSKGAYMTSELFMTERVSTLPKHNNQCRSENAEDIMNSERKLEYSPFQWECYPNVPYLLFC